MNAWICLRIMVQWLILKRAYHVCYTLLMEKRMNGRTQENIDPTLDAARQVDAWIQSIWEWVQSHPQYKDKTALLITTDHGRGDLKKEQWTGHGSSIDGASQIWFAVIGPGIAGQGEMSNTTPYFQEQFAQTIASFLGENYKADHPIAEPIKLPGN
ncbi:MAG: hypothetical protein NVV59_16645 [Chitinophagaceae bacterium]|nr:hypothetical protein [Chitinophagaceae bacterium]